ncbi:MAG: helix-turn-helix domain-containing protein [Deltaproteobacteria bacterium]|jgi:excisionase family DNA binding protein|nr:helix-turn-helix domain-containing protein [Deltaproteobacteria bacterium]
MKHLLTVKEAAEYLRLAESTIYKMVSRRDIPFMKIGTRVIFDLEMLAEWVEAHTVQPVGGKRRRVSNAA